MVPKDSGRDSTDSLATRLADYLKGLEEQVLSKLESDDPGVFIADVSAVEEIKFLTARHGDTIRAYDLKTSTNELERLVLDQSKKFVGRKREDVIRELRSTTRHHVRAVRSAARLLKWSELLERWDSTEFDHDVFSLRELLEYCYPALQRLGYERVVATSRSKIRSVDPLLERLSRDATLLYFKTEEYKAAEPAWFPETFWWRQSAWEVYQGYLTNREESMIQRDDLPRSSL